MKSCTTTTYHHRVSLVLTYICHHLDEALTVDVLAQKACFSPYHFHRIFRAIAGETVGESIQRVRLEFAAREIRTNGQDIAIVAQRCGYESAEAFSRAFRRGFGVPPGAYRRSTNHPLYRGTSTRILFNPETLHIELLPYIEETDMQITIQIKPELTYAYLTHYGPYNEVGELFDRVVEVAMQHGIDPSQSEIFSLSYDSPLHTPPEKLRSDVCIEIPAHLPEATLAKIKEEQISITTRNEGRYAVHTHKGNYSGISDAYQQMLGNWASNSEEEIADAPFVEIYRNDSTALPDSQWITDLCIPLKTSAV